MTRRSAKLTEVTRLLKAARKADVSVCIKFPDGTTIETIAKTGDLNSDLDAWMKKNDANSA